MHNCVEISEKCSEATDIPTSCETCSNEKRLAPPECDCEEGYLSLPK